MIVDEEELWLRCRKNIGMRERSMEKVREAKFSIYQL